MASIATKAMAVADMEKSQAKAKQAEPSIQQWLDLITNEAPKLPFAEAAKLFSGAAKLQQQQAGIEQQARIDALADVMPKLEAAIGVAINSVLSAEQKKICDGIWYSYDYASGDWSLRLFKPVSERKQRPSNGAAKSYHLNTTELLAKHGAENASNTKFPDASFNQLMEIANSVTAPMEAKARSNFVFYQIREKLIAIDKAAR